MNSCDWSARRHLRRGESKLDRRYIDPIGSAPSRRYKGGQAKADRCSSNERWQPAGTPAGRHSRRNPVATNALATRTPTPEHGLGESVDVTVCDVPKVGHRHRTAWRARRRAVMSAMPALWQVHAVMALLAGRKGHERACMAAHLRTNKPRWGHLAHRRHVIVADHCCSPSTDHLHSIQAAPARQQAHTARRHHGQSTSRADAQPAPPRACRVQVQIQPRPAQRARRQAGRQQLSVTYKCIKEFQPL